MPLLLNASTDDPRILVALGLGALVLCYMLMRGNRKRKDPLDKPSSFMSLSQQRSVERQMQNLLVELSEMARQMSAQLDTRSAKLEQLLADADERIAKLKALDHGRSEPARPLRLAAEEPIAHEVDPRHTDVYSLADQGRSPADIAQQLNRPRGEVELILALRAR